MFNETPIKASKCALTLTKIIYMLYQGEQLHQKEATDLFFSVTKLFQSKDTQLRRLVYLVIKELSGIAQDVIMATSSLTKDMNDRLAAEVGYRSNAIRALCTVTDASMVQTIERFLKQAIVDKDNYVASAALVSSIHLFTSGGGRDVVKRWVNEVQEAVNKPTGLVQYHALGMLYLIKQHDKMAVSKVIQTLVKGNLLRYPLSYCMVIRYTQKILDEDGGLDGPSGSLFSVLEGCLRHRHEIVNLEAARAICSLNGATNKEIIPAVSVLQLFLNSPKPTLRFAAIRTLSKLAINHPTAVQVCNVDMETLISDPNRSIATFAITTLLKTGNETSVDRLMKQITGMISELSDEFKVIVVDAILSLCLKFPAKHGMMLQFLASGFNESGYEFKKAIVEAFFEIFEELPESREAVLGHLCEYIDDCEFVRLAVRILHLLGEEGPKMPNPTKYIRYIYNRTILEVAPVRAAAVSALAKFAVVLGGQAKKNINTLLTRCLDDPDDEVRDRSVMYLRLINDLPPEESETRVRDQTMYSIDALEEQLVNYVSNPDSIAKPFEIHNVPILPRGDGGFRIKQAKSATYKFAKSAGIAPVSPSKSKAEEAEYMVSKPASNDKKISQIPEFAHYGPVFRSSAPVDLTETDVAEYIVSCIKHTYKEHTVFQFVCRNTMNDVLLENVEVSLETDDGDLLTQLVPDQSLPVAKLSHGEPSSAYVSFKRLQLVPALGSFTCKLKFISKDCDPSTGEPDAEGFEDTYNLENIELGVGDYIVPTYSANFANLWNQIGDSHEIVETLQLDALEHIPAAVQTVKEIVGMSACENSDRFPADKAPNTIASHTLLLSGTFLGGFKCACRVRMASPGAGITMELAVRADTAEVAQMISESLG